MLILPEINFLHPMAPTPSQGPPIPQTEGGLMGYVMTMAEGWEGTRNLDHIYIYIILLI